MTVAAALAARRPAEGLSPDFAADAVLAELAPAVLRSSHRESEKQRPPVQAVLAGLGEGERQKVVLWFFQVCGLCGLDDPVLYNAVLLLDRYCAAARAPLAIDRLHLKALAIFSIAIKVTGGADENSKPRKLRELLQHIGQRSFPVEAIFSAEIEVLRVLKFEVSAPTPLEFLDALVLPLATPGDGTAPPDGPVLPSPVACLARFLLQLSLLDVQLHYRYPHAALAAGAAYVALWCTRARPERVAALLSDVGSCQAGPELETAIAVVRRALRHKGLDSEWTSALAGALRGPSEASELLRSVLARHGWTGTQFMAPPDRRQLFVALLAAALDGEEPPRPRGEVFEEVLVDQDQAGEDYIGIAIDAGSDALPELVGCRHGPPQPPQPRQQPAPRQRRRARERVEAQENGVENLCSALVPLQLADNSELRNRTVLGASKANGAWRLI